MPVMEFGIPDKKMTLNEKKRIYAQPNAFS